MGRKKKKPERGTTLYWCFHDTTRQRIRVWHPVWNQGTFEVVNWDKFCEFRNLAISFGIFCVQDPDDAIGQE